MRAPIEIHRSPQLTLFGAGVGTIFLMIWAGEGDRIMGSTNGPPYVAASLFIWVFVLPFTAYLAWLGMVRSPIAAIYDDRIELRHVTFPWRRVTIPYSGITNLEPNFQPQDENSDVIFTLEEDDYATLASSRVWRKRDPRLQRLSFTVMNATASPRDLLDLLIPVVRRFKEGGSHEAWPTAR